MRSHPPSSLLELQCWFKEAITSPLQDRESLEFPPVFDKAPDYIKPSHSLTSLRRIQIYQEQYWWRLIGHLKEVFPSLLRLFDSSGFCHLLAVPYLQSFPSRHFSLGGLSQKMPLWIKRYYKEADQPLVYFSAVLDVTYERVFASSSPKECPSLALETPLALQEHVKLLKLPFNLPVFREELLKQEVGFWLEQDFPPLKKGKRFYVFYRSPHCAVAYQEIDPCEWTFLNLIQKGSTLAACCEKIEEKGGDFLESAQKNLPAWIEKWIHGRWIVKPEN